MNNRKIAALLFVAFFVGDSQAVIRANRYWRKKISNLKRDNSLMKMKLDVCHTYFAGIHAGKTHEELEQLVRSDIEFIDLIESQP